MKSVKCFDTEDSAWFQPLNQPATGFLALHPDALRRIWHQIRFERIQRCGRAAWYQVSSKTIASLRNYKNEFKD